MRRLFELIGRAHANCPLAQMFADAICEPISNVRASLDDAVKSARTADTERAHDSRRTDT